MFSVKYLERSRLGLLVACLSAGLLLNGCGGVSNEVQFSGQNTPLLITPQSKIPTLTVGISYSFTVTVTDPDGVDSVSATIDGAAANLSVSGSNYTLTLPATLTVGTHTLTVTGRGKAPDGTLEVPQTLSLAFTVYPANTPATISAVNGSNHYTQGATPTLSVDVADPDGIASVSATLDANAITVSAAAGTYSVQMPATLSVGTHKLVFTAVGKNPDGSNESPLTASQDITVYKPNTPLAINSLSGPSSYTVGAAQTFTVQIQDPDTISSVTATLDGSAWPITAGTGGNYVVNVPGTLQPGQHRITVTAVGLQPDGSTEQAQTVTKVFTVYNLNTPLTISAVARSFNLAQDLVLTVTVVDPDGILSVTGSITSPSPLATLPYTVTQSGSTYTMTLPFNSSVGYDGYCGYNNATFKAIGLNPDGSQEAPQTSSFDPTTQC